MNGLAPIRYDDPGTETDDGHLALQLDAKADCRFRLMHLIERKSRPQNSTAWLKIEPNDYLPHPQTLMKW